MYHHGHPVRTSPPALPPHLAWRSLQSVTTRDLAALPVLRTFKSAFAGSVSMCAGLIPCNGNLFLGVEGMERTVQLQVGSLVVGQEGQAVEWMRASDGR